MPAAAKKTRTAKKTNSKKKPKARSTAQPKRPAQPTAVVDDREVQRRVLASDKRYYRIGEVSELTNVKAHVLRYWESEFRWMAPPKSRSKQRLYRKKDIELVLLLKRLLWEERYTIAGARQRIQELGVDGAIAMLSEPPTSAGSKDLRPSQILIDELRDELIAVRDVLQESA
ncbi:MAG: MerR family transcriptional regulator [Myxococcota bacterium]